MQKPFPVLTTLRISSKDGFAPVLPADLTSFYFQGASDYLEAIVSRIDTPQLNRIDIHYLNQLAGFRVAQLPMFIDRSVALKLTPFTCARVTFSSYLIAFNLNTSHHANGLHPDPPYTILCQGTDQQVWHTALLLNHASAILSNVVHLKLEVFLKRDGQLEGTDVIDWLHLFRQFPTVHTLHVSQELSGYVSLALERITVRFSRETVAELMPSLDLIYLAELPASSIEKFVAARQLSGRPVTVVETETEFDEKLAVNISE